MRDYIEIKGASEHNLKGIDVNIPRNKLVVITGVSGSGKSSLAFDTLYAEGQRRYVESLSAYARQFLEQMPKPQVESIEGLSPAIAIDQKATSRNPRSTVGTVTEIYDYLRLLFARIGRPYCWNCGRPIESMTVQQIAETVMAKAEGDKGRIIIYAPVVRDRKGEYQKLFEELARGGFVRVRVDGETFDIEEVPPLNKYQNHTIDVIVDRIVIKKGVRTRLVDSLETAAKLGQDIVKVGFIGGEEEVFSEKNSCPVCGISYPEISPRFFSFNSPHGACPTCGGLGVLLEFDPDLVIPDKSLSLIEGAIAPWGVPPNRFARRLIRHIARRMGFDPGVPFVELDPDIQNAILYGGSGKSPYSYRFSGVIPNLMKRMKGSDSDETGKYGISKYLNIRPCPTCNGARLKKEALHVLVGSKNIYDITRLSVDDVLIFFQGLELTEKEQHIAGRVIREIVQRARFLKSVGLGYLSLDRAASTLSAGESQRIRLATQIGSALTGVMYVLDEPTVGLHQRDNMRLIDTLKHLRDIGNTVIVVEHDERAIMNADHVIDLGPGAGEGGGHLVFEGKPDKIKNSKESITGKYLSGELEIEVPESRRKPRHGFIKIMGASANNLKSIDVDIPLGLFTCVTGVSGSGKSTLVVDTLYPYVSRYLEGSRPTGFKVKEIKGLELIDRVINVDQSPIGRTPRSNPATYTNVFTYIRELFALLPDARMRGYRPGRFSFNVKGGRCEACKGEGMIKVEMHFLPDIYVKCDQCKGSRYNRETLDIRYKGVSIADVLDMTVSQAYELFDAVPRIRRKLKTLMDVGMDYIKLGQSATTLSGGEAQRIKLSRELSKKATGRTLYILDEPTTGLHFDDINKLLKVLRRLVDQGNTVVVIEHNMDVIKYADYIIDLGPEGGDMGGRVVASGSPEDIARIHASYTGAFLRPYLGI